MVLSENGILSGGHVLYFVRVLCTLCTPGFLTPVYT